MTDGKTYNVVLDGTTQTFVASDGKVDHLGVTPTEIVAKTETDISAVLYDVNGVVVQPEAAYKGNGVRTGKNNALDFNISTSQGYTTEKGLQLYEVGNTATATLELHSNKYDSNGNEIENVKGTATIKAVPAATVTNQSFSIKVGDSGKNFDSVKESVVAQGDANKSAYIQIKLSDGKTTSDLSNYTVESSDLNVVILNKQKGPQSGEIKLIPVRPGTCNIIIRDANDTVIKVLSVTVKETRYAATLNLGKYAATLSNRVEETVSDQYIADTDSTKVSVLDQYNEDYDTSKGTFDYTNKTLDGKNNSTAIGLVSGSALTVTAEAATTAGIATTAKGTYVGVVSYTEGSKTLSKTFVTTVQQPEDTVDSYQMVLDKTDVDAVITDDAKANTTVNAQVFGYDGGIKRKVYTAAATWKLNEGNAVKNDALGAVSSSSITVNNISTGDRMPATTYSYTAQFKCDNNDVNKGIVKTITRSVVVKDSQHVPTVILDNDGKITANTNVDEFIKAYYYSKDDKNTCVVTGIKTNDKNVTTVSQLINNVKATNGTSYMVYEVYVTTTLEHGNKVKSTVTLNHTVSKDGNW